MAAPGGPLPPPRPRRVAGRKERNTAPPARSPGLADIFSERFSDEGQILHNNTGCRYKAGDEISLPDMRIRIGRGTLLEPGAKVYSGVTIGESSIIATDAAVKPGCTIGNHSIIGTKCNLEGDNSVGDWTTIHSQCHLTQEMSVGGSCFIGPMLCAVGTPRIGTDGCRFGFPNSTKMPRRIPHIRDGCHVGSRVLLAPGVVIGRDSRVGMGAFVKRSLEPGTVVGPGETVG